MTNNKAGLKKVFSLLIICLLIFSVSVSLQAAEGFTLTASEKKDVSGKQVVVSVVAENAAGTEGGQFVLNFDPNLLKPVTVEPGELVTGASSALDMANMEYADGQLMFMWVTAAADTADSGEVCIITFDLLNEGETALTFADVVVAPDNIEEVTTIPGKLTITNVEVEKQEDNDQGALGATGTDATGYLWLIGLIVLVIAAAAAWFVFFKRRKKPVAKH